MRRYAFRQKVDQFPRLSGCCALNWKVVQQNKPQNKEGGGDVDAPKSKKNQKPKNKSNNKHELRALNYGPISEIYR
jgi:hypothetical protein